MKKKNKWKWNKEERIHEYSDGVIRATIYNSGPLVSLHWTWSVYFSGEVFMTGKSRSVAIAKRQAKKALFEAELKRLKELLKGNK